MTDMDPLRPLLREWEAPEPSAALDARVRAGFRASIGPSAWRRFLTARVSIPVPVLAATVVLLALAWLIQPRPEPAAPTSPGVITRLEATGFQPLPDGEARVQDIRQ